MQKKLIAAAVVSALAVSTSALADSANVSISGWVSAGIAKYKAEDKSGEMLVSDGRYSRIRFTGEEDIGNGLKGHFTIESRFVVDQGSSNAVATAWLNGNAGAGLAGKEWGKITLGRWDLHYNEGTVAALQDLTLNQAQPLSHLSLYSVLTQVPQGFAGTQLGMGTYAITPSRYNNVILYNTPVWSGFYGKLAYSTNHRGNEGDGTNNGSKGATKNVVAGYLAGPITAGVSLIDIEKEGEQTTFSFSNYDAKGLRAWFSYVFPFGLKVGVLYDKTEQEIASSVWGSRTAIGIPVSYAFGNHVIHADYGMADDATFDGTEVSDTGAKFMSIGYDYKLSKRTSVGASYAQIKNDTNVGYQLFFAGVSTTGNNYINVGSLTGSATGLGKKATELYFGVNHLF